LKTKDSYNGGCECNLEFENMLMDQDGSCYCKNEFFLMEDGCKRCPDIVENCVDGMCGIMTQRDSGHRLDKTADLSLYQSYD
jgi:hypothetical protein